MPTSNSSGTSCLIVDDDPIIHHIIESYLQETIPHIQVAENGFQAIDIISNQSFDIIITDFEMPSIDGIGFIKMCRALHLHTPIIMISAHIDNQLKHDAIDLGAYDFITKPFDKDKILSSVNGALNDRRIDNAIDTSVSAMGAESGLVAGSHIMEAVTTKLIKIANTDETVLITGESGTGKELVADFIRNNSRRNKAPFIKVNCSAIPESLIESELFGHEKGAFTGAETERMGKFEMANGGTLFLDEIGDFPFHLQPKLLRVLQERTCERLGSAIPIPLDIRIISATNMSLKDKVKDNKFRLDLFYRLNTLSIDLPPLRERGQDIELLSQHFLIKLSAQYGKTVLNLTDAAKTVLNQHHWPGNVRELIGVLTRAVIYADGSDIAAHLIKSCIEQSGYGSNEESGPSFDSNWINENKLIHGLYAESELEAVYAAHVFELNNHHKTNTCKALGIDYKTLAKRLKEARNISNV